MICEMERKIVCNNLKLSSLGVGSRVKKKDSLKKSKQYGKELDDVHG